MPMKTSIPTWFTAGIVLGFLAHAAAAARNEPKVGIPSVPHTPSTIPYVPTRHDTVRDLLWLADVGTNDVVYDLGSGDGRVVIAAVRDFGARRAVGIEVNPQLVRESRENAAQAGVASRVEFIQGDLFTNDFSLANVVVLYLGHEANLDLRARLVRTLKPGARVVAHKFGMGEWPADKTLDLRTPHLGMYGEHANPFGDNPDVPDFTSIPSQGSHDTLSVWLVPVPLAGVWRGKVRLEGGESELRLTLHQRLAGLSGTFQLQGCTNAAGYLQPDFWGDHFRCGFWATNASHCGFMMMFDGHVTGHALKGTLAMLGGDQARELPWEARRDSADFTGTWEWLALTNTPVQLKIERHDGRLTATYQDKSRATLADPNGSQPMPVADFYDFGGGFYFTLLLGREGTSRRMGPDEGWLIGEARLLGNALTGSIAFYPYSQHTFWSAGLASPPQPGQPDNQAMSQPGWREWLPNRVAP